MTKTGMMKLAAAAGFAVCSLSAGPALASNSAAAPHRSKIEIRMMKKCQQTSSTKQQLKTCMQIMRREYGIQPLIQQ